MMEGKFICLHSDFQWECNIKYKTNTSGYQNKKSAEPSFTITCFLTSHSLSLPSNMNDRTKVSAE